MNKTQATHYLNTGAECLRLRSKNDHFGERVRIVGIGYHRSSSVLSRYDHYAGGNGILCEVLRYDDGEPTGTKRVYPLAQLHATTMAEFKAERDHRYEAHVAREQEALALRQAKVVRLEALVGQLGAGRVGQSAYGMDSYIILSEEDAEGLVTLIDVPTPPAVPWARRTP